ncbi:MAG: hypothetical protein A2014_08385 [Spirochaetes bacterium GWF1_49_6]|jgi:hypothetical protein|nr:MAG: hypothetical protein A2014_08385 [Spirochaetes bacterium GWF1_49_6]
MSKLVETLKEEHAIIADALNKIKTAGVTTKAGKELLLSAKAGLLSHLKHEDEELYPLLKNAAKNDENLLQTLSLFAGDMDSISTTALTFFDKYSKDNHDTDFAKDFGRLFSILSNRIRREESIIYSKYEELNVKK